MDEQEVTMSAHVSTIEGIGKQAIDVFVEAGFTTIGHLRGFNGQDRQLWQAIEKRKANSAMDMPDSHWKRLMTRCINIIYRARSAQATPFIPAEYMCPITLNWFEDPVVTSSGHTYSRYAILEHLKYSRLDPVTRIDISGLPMYDNIAMRDAVDHYRLNHQKFSILS